MACVEILASLITIAILSSFLALPSHGMIHSIMSSPVIAATPALLPNPPLSPYVAVSPDIAPLFPTPGGGSTMPTIPSTRSPPNPDTTIGPDAAVAPSGALRDSSAGDDVLARGLRVVGGFCSFLAYLLVMFFI